MKLKENIFFMTSFPECNFFLSTNSVSLLSFEQGKMKDQEDQHKQLMDEEARQKTELSRAKQALEQEMKQAKEVLTKQDENLKALGERKLV